ncbi:acyl carrier protein [uncultured Clostridium sp.]|nr:acyl carrier protein [uncultured Clostridium sp.]
MLPLPNEIQSFEEVTKPRNDNEKIILAIWKEVLKVDEINITDTFYDIGGDSVSMVKILNILKDRFGITLDVMSFITNNTIEAMAKLLD